MEVTKCDRCGEYIDKLTSEMPVIAYRFRADDAYNVNGKTEKVTVCYECYNRFLDWVKPFDQEEKKDDICPPTPGPFVFDHETGKVRKKTNGDVLNENFGHIIFSLDTHACHLEDALTVQTEDGENLNFLDWFKHVYVEPKEETNADND